MHILVLLCALAMPTIAWFSQRGAFGPDNGTVSNQYPTLLVAAGYAFSIWGVIFLLDVAFAAWQLGRARADERRLSAVRGPVALGFALTASWMIVFSQQWFWLALAVIWGALGCMVYAALALSRDPPLASSTFWLAKLPISLHAGWLSLAAFLNLAQVIVAFKLLPVDRMLPWSALLLAAAAALLLWLNQRMRGNVGYTLAAVWGLVAVYVKQSSAGLAGGDVAAWIAIAMAGVLAAQTIVLSIRGSNPAAAGVVMPR